MLPRADAGELPQGAPSVQLEPVAMPKANRARVEAMFEAHHNLVWRTLRRNGLDPESAADIGQQAYLVAIERVADIWPGSERAFLVGTALRLSRKQRRKAARVTLEADLDLHARDVAHPEAQASTLQLLDRMLAQLEEQLVEVFVLSDVEGFSAPEVAAALDLPVGTVASRLRRAREQFRAAVQRLDAVRKREEGER